MTTPPPSIWLITGASSGIGKSLALEALNSNCRVIGATRDISKAESSFPDFVAKGGTWIALDPARKDAFEQFSKCAREYNVDVLIDNAGYAFIGGVEDTSEDEVSEQMEVKFYGPLPAVRACLPVMRGKGSGNIVLISSGAGHVALMHSAPLCRSNPSRPARSSYSASKFAIEAVYESLSHEVKTFCIKVLIVEPGAFRTPFASRILAPAQYQDSNGLGKAYKGTAVEKMVKGTVNIMSIPDFVKGDPDKAACAIVKAVMDGHDYLRMPLGPDCVTALEDKIGQLQGDLNATRVIAMGTNFE